MSDEKEQNLTSEKLNASSVISQNNRLRDTESKVPQMMEELTEHKNEVEERASEQSTKLEKFKNTDLSTTLDLTKNSHKNYKQFISNLLSIMEGAIWTNKPYKNLWIDQVFVQFPKDKLRERTNHIKHRRFNKAYTTPDFSEENLDPNTEVDIFEVSINPEEIRKLKPRLDWRAPKKLNEILKSMSNLVHTFLSKDWAPKGDKDIREGSDLVWSPISIRTSKEGDSGGFWLRHTLRLIRVYEGKYYYCDIYFTNGMQKNMIRTNYVYYKDADWREGAYYQANGDWGYYGKNIGGDGRFLWWKQRSWNNIDSELSTLFDPTPERDKLLWKWFEVISRCLQVEECHKTLQSSSYTTLTQREKPISRNDSYKQDIYKRIHPFANIYYEVSDQLNKQELEFSLQS